MLGTMGKRRKKVLSSRKLFPQDELRYFWDKVCYSLKRAIFGVDFKDIEFIMDDRGLNAMLIVSM